MSSPSSSSSDKPSSPDTDDLSIVEGALARPIDLSVAKNSVSNQRLMKFDGMCALMCWLFSSLTQVSGQSTLVHSVSMMSAGASFMVCAVRRKTEGPPENYQAHTAASAIWMMSSLQQFHKFRKMKWAGFSSWSGFLLTSVYGTLELFRMLGT
jgi:hypothetical protein